MILVGYDRNTRSLTDIELWWKSYNKHVIDETRQLRGRVRNELRTNIINGQWLIELGVYNMLLYYLFLLIGLLSGKVVIGAESRLKQYYTKANTGELRAEEDSITNVNESTRKLIELAENKTKFKGMPCDVENKAVFRTCVNICLVHFFRSINWCYTVYNTIVSQIFHRVR